MPHGCFLGSLVRILLFSHHLFKDLCNVENDELQLKEMTLCREREPRGGKRHSSCQGRGWRRPSSSKEGHLDARIRGSGAVADADVRAVQQAGRGEDGCGVRAGVAGGHVSSCRCGCHAGADSYTPPNPCSMKRWERGVAHRPG